MSGLDRRYADTGAATVLALTSAVVLAVAAAVGVMVGGAVLVRQRAGAVADVTALAAARQLLQPASVPCAAARRTAAANGARLRACVVDGATVLVTVSVPAPGWLAWLGAAPGQARAGLVSDISHQAGPIDAAS
jgi:secretion/DNA translocation related TadE-like protein